MREFKDSLSGHSDDVELDERPLAKSSPSQPEA
jgi:hypothetical protein